MSLPGKLCVGILEEDNPLRSYFRFKPLLVEENGRYFPFTEAENYPDQGCIRIVPDKNESYFFKSRMRQNGLFCIVDLRDHPNENDKIRPNKNYRPGGEENNAYIIYSDVVRTPAAEMIYQLLPVEAAARSVAKPHTPKVLLKQPNGINPVFHEWAAAEDAEGMGTLKPTEQSCALSDFQAFDVGTILGQPLSFIIKPAALMTAVCDAPDRSLPRHEAAQPAPDKFAREDRPVVNVKREIPAPVPAPKRELPPKPETPLQPEAAAPTPAQTPEVPQAEPPAPMPAEAPQAEKPAPQVEAPVQPEQPPIEAPKPPVAEIDPPNKPWIHRDARMQPKPIDRRLSRSEQLMAAQVGLNPRRGRSLQELIDEKWQYSRLNQLGTPVQIATGAPVRNPIDVARDAVRNVWSDPRLRSQLLDALAQLDSFSDSFKERRELTRQSIIAQQLNALEAQRLELLADIDRLKAAGQQVRDNLKQEIRKEEAADLADSLAQTRAAQAEKARYEQLADDARKAAQDARTQLDELVGDQLEAKIRDIALTRRVQERLDMLRGEIPMLPTKPESAGITALIDRLLARAEAEGWRMSRADAANLCVCMALSPVLLLSGVPGCGKTTVARLLCEALGTDADRAIVLPPDPRSLCGDKRLAALDRFPDAPATLVLDDANLAPGRDILRGLGQRMKPEWRLIVTVQDAHSGMPLSASALDRGFVVRLTAPASLPWQPAARNPLPPEMPIAIESVRASLPCAEVPEALVKRMDALRLDMAACGAEISRRALDDAWRYCAAMLAVMGGDANPDAIFDRAVAQRILPATLASAPASALPRLRKLANDMPACAALLKCPLPVDI